MAHRHKKGGNSAKDVDIGRREALTRLGLGVSVAYAAPVLLTLGSAQAGVVIGDGDLDNHNDKGDGGSDTHQKPGNGGGHGYGHHKGRGKGHEKGHQGKRVTVRELLEYLANFGKKGRK
jgi:hypothetical protein